MIVKVKAPNNRIQKHRLHFTPKFAVFVRRARTPWTPIALSPVFFKTAAEASVFIRNVQRGHKSAPGRVGRWFPYGQNPEIACVAIVTEA
jgi:hypothetical protein